MGNTSTPAQRNQETKARVAKEENALREKADAVIEKDRKTEQGVQAVLQEFLIRYAIEEWMKNDVSREINTSTRRTAAKRKLEARIDAATNAPKQLREYDGKTAVAPRDIYNDILNVDGKVKNTTEFVQEILDPANDKKWAERADRNHARLLVLASKMSSGGPSSQQSRFVNDAVYAVRQTEKQYLKYLDFLTRTDPDATAPPEWNLQGDEYLLEREAKTRPSVWAFPLGRFYKKKENPAAAPEPEPVPKSSKPKAVPRTKTKTAKTPTATGTMYNSLPSASRTTRSQTRAKLA
jgi:hypothetical protein